MKRKAGVALIAMTFVLIGWVAGRAQIRNPDFEIVVNAPDGETTIDCVKGCSLMWIERGISNSAPMLHFRFSCRGAQRCGSGRIGGWFEP